MYLQARAGFPATFRFYLHLLGFEILNELHSVTQNKFPSFKRGLFPQILLLGGGPPPLRDFVRFSPLLRRSSFDHPVKPFLVFFRTSPLPVRNSKHLLAFRAFPPHRRFFSSNFSSFRRLYRKVSPQFGLHATSLRVPVTCPLPFVGAFLFPLPTPSESPLCGRGSPGRSFFFSSPYHFLSLFVLFPLCRCPYGLFSGGEPCPFNPCLSS